MASNKNNTLVFLSIVAGLLIFSWIFIKPNFQKLNELNDAITWTQEDIRVLEEAKKRIEESTTFVNQLDAHEKELIKLALPSFKDKAAVAYLVNKIAEENGVILTSVQVTENNNTKSTVSKLVPLNIIFRADGSYASLKFFLGKLESSLRIFDTNNIDILKRPEGGILSVSVKGTTYYTIE